MKNLYLILFILPLIGFGQQRVLGDELNTKNNKVFYNGHLFSGTEYHNYDNGDLLMEINYVDGVQNGVQKMYHPNGQIAQNHLYKNGQIVDGTYVDLFPNGEKNGVFIYKNGKLNGKGLVYYESGQLWRETLWENGIKISEIEFPIEENEIKKTEKEKIIKYSESKGEKVEKKIETYEEIKDENGRLILKKIIKSYNANGRKISETYFNVKDEKDGNHTEWFDNGELKQKGQFKNGKEFGVWTTYYSNGQKFEEFIYKFDNGRRECCVWLKYWDEYGNRLN